MAAIKRKKIGIALSGGGARGFAHVGVLRALVENGIPIDFIAGTSVGSFVGGAYAAGLSAEEIIKIGRGVGWSGFAGFAFSHRGLLTNRPMAKFIERHFPVHRFEDLAIPFAAVACELKNGAEIIYRDTGDLSFAIRASCAVPGVFAPLIDGDGRMIVDGGVVSPLPVRAARAMGADIVIAIDLLACGSTPSRGPSTILGAVLRSALTLLQSASRGEHHAADFVITPLIAHIRQEQIGRMDELVELGEEAGANAIERILPLLSKADA